MVRCFECDIVMKLVHWKSKWLFGVFLLESVLASAVKKMENMEGENLREEDDEPKKKTLNHGDFLVVPDSIFEREAKHQRSKQKKRFIKKPQLNLPPNLCLNIKIFYNEPFKNTIKESKPEKFFKDLVQEANKIFQLKGLRSNIKLTVNGKPTHVLDQSAHQWSPNDPDPSKMEIYTKHISNDPQVHNFVFFTTVKNGDSNAGRAFLGTVCMSMQENQKVKLSVISYSIDVKGTAFVLAHELGHAIGIGHDFQENSVTKTVIKGAKRTSTGLRTGIARPPRTSKSGQACTNVHGVMDYDAKFTKWTECSYEDAYDSYQKLATAGPFCLETACGTNGGPSHGIGQINQTTGGQGNNQSDLENVTNVNQDNIPVTGQPFGPSTQGTQGQGNGLQGGPTGISVNGTTIGPSQGQGNVTTGGQAQVQPSNSTVGSNNGLRNNTVLGPSASQANITVGSPDNIQSVNQNGQVNILRNNQTINQGNISGGNTGVGKVIQGPVLTVQQPPNSLNGLGPRPIKVGGFRSIVQRNDPEDYSKFVQEDDFGEFEYHSYQDMSYDSETIYGNSFVDQESYK